MTSQPLDAVQTLQQARLRAASLPPGVVVAQVTPATPQPQGEVAQAVTGAAATIRTVQDATQALVSTHVDLAQQEAEVKALEIQERKEDILDRQVERAEERRERRRGGGVAEMFQLVQSMLTTFQQGSSSEVSALRSDIANFQRQQDEAARETMAQALDQKYESLAQTIDGLRVQIATGTGSSRAVEQVKEAQQEIRDLAELFGAPMHPTAVSAQANAQDALLQHRLRQEQIKFEEDIEDRREQRLLERQRFLAELESIRTRDQQTGSLIESAVPALDRLAGKYLNREGVSAPAEAPAPAGQPQHAAPPAPVTLPPEVALATCPACGGQAPIPFGYGERHGVCVSCGRVVATTATAPTADGFVPSRLVSADALPLAVPAPPSPTEPEPVPIVNMADYREPSVLY